MEPGLAVSFPLQHLAELQPPQTPQTDVPQRWAQGFLDVRIDAVGGLAAPAGRSTTVKAQRLFELPLQARVAYCTCDNKTLGPQPR